MHGNVWEWVADLFGPYSMAPQVDPWGPTEGQRVLRGGCYGDGAVYASAAARRTGAGESQYIGFRVVPTGPEVLRA
jgi:formylglycine-generating enzyme required for sulfatase activity